MCIKECLGFGALNVSLYELLGIFETWRAGGGGDHMAMGDLHVHCLHLNLHAFFFFFFFFSFRRVSSQNYPEAQGTALYKLYITSILASSKVQLEKVNLHSDHAWVVLKVH